jgi:ABC-type transporter Mla subunit MlaD
MDSTALQALIAEVRGTAAALAETEKRVASFTAELAQQDQAAHPVTKPVQQTPTLSKRGRLGWVPAG